MFTLTDALQGLEEDYRCYTVRQAGMSRLLQYESEALRAQRSFKNSLLQSVTGSFIQITNSCFVFAFLSHLSVSDQSMTLINAE